MRKRGRKNHPLLLIDGQPAVMDGLDIDEIEKICVEYPDTINQTGEEDEQAGLGWLNYVAIHLRPQDDEVSCSISVGEPRGCFSFTIYRNQDGKLIMFVPYPEEGLLHRPLKEIRRGTYEIG